MFTETNTYIGMIDQWDQFIVWTAFEISISLSKIHVDMHFALEWRHYKSTTGQDFSTRTKDKNDLRITRYRSRCKKMTTTATCTDRNYKSYDRWPLALGTNCLLSRIGGGVEVAPLVDLGRRRQVSSTYPCRRINN